MNTHRRSLRQGGPAIGSAQVRIENTAILGSATSYSSGIGRAVDPERLVISVTSDVIEPLRLQVEQLSAQVSALANGRSVALSTLGAPGLRLRAPLWVALHDGEETVSASSTDLECYGVGDSDAEALEDLRIALVSDYRFLVGNEDRLGVNPRRLLALFRELIEETQ